MYAGISESLRLILREAQVGSHHSLINGLSRRDHSVLLVLDQYRYLDTHQLCSLFFTSDRKSRSGLQRLADCGLVRSWRAMLQPGRISRPTVHLLSTRGARTLAQHRGEDPRPFVARASNAAARTRTLVHDLEANGFFVSLAAASRCRADEGLYHWLGPSTCRLVSKRERVPPSDGWGRYLVADGELRVYLEWDRGTEHPARLATMAAAYARYFAGRQDADRRHVVFVLPTDAREREVQSLLGRTIESGGDSCRVWTASADALRAEGALGSIWLEVGSAEARRSLSDLPASARPELAVANCIGKPKWWERRLGGGEGP